MPTYAVLIVTCLLFRLSAATEVDICGGDPNAIVSISNCEGPPCILKRNTTIKMSIEMTPDKDVTELKNSVHAIMGIVMPFIGVDNTDACPNVFKVDGSQAGCPLKKGVTYIYKNEFPIRKMYPKMELIVSWILKNGEEDVIACFEVKSKITD